MRYISLNRLHLCWPTTHLLNLNSVFQQTKCPNLIIYSILFSLEKWIKDSHTHKSKLLFPYHSIHTYLYFKVDVIKLKIAVKFQKLVGGARIGFLSRILLLLTLGWFYMLYLLQFDNSWLIHEGNNHIFLMGGNPI